MGAAAVEMRARQIPIMQSGVGGLILINLVISFALPGISWGGHVGGLIGGAVATLVFQLGARYRSQALALAGCAAIGVAAFAGSIAICEGDRSRNDGSGPVGRTRSVRRAGPRRPCHPRRPRPRDPHHSRHQLH